MASIGSNLQNYPVPTLPQLPGGDPIFWRNELQKISKAINLLVKDFQKLDQGTWTSYTPTLTPQTGTLTAATATGGWVQFDKTVHFYVYITITTVGTATGYLQISLPSTPAGYGSAQGREDAVTFKGCNGAIYNGVNFIHLLSDDAAAAVMNSGGVLVIGGTYQTQ